MMKFAAFVVLILINAVTAKTGEKKAGKDSDKTPDDPDLLEYAHDDHHGTEHEHVHTQLFLGMAKPRNAFEHLTNEQRNEKLEQVFRKIDTNSDGQLDFLELREWMVKSIESIDNEVGKDTIGNDDVDGDGKISWLDILRGRHSMREKHFEELSSSRANNSEIRGLVEHIEEEKRTFHLADTNKDGSLDHVEYAAFTMPWKHKHMLAFEADDIMERADTNKDKVIDLEEYEKFRNVKGKSQKYLENVRKRYHLMDVNDDDKVSHSELLRTLEAPLEKRSVQEARHIINEMDKNKDGYISKSEVFDRVGYMLGHEHEVMTHDEL